MGEQGEHLPSVLIVDDDRHLADQLRWALGKTCRITLAHDRVKALDALRERPPDLLLLDLCLPPENTPEEGFRVLRVARSSALDIMVVVMSASEEREAALKAIAEGAYDFFVKPLDLDALKIVIGRALERQILERENRRLRDELCERFQIGGVVGVSASMERVCQAIRRVADSPITVILQGESGTGKDLIARAIHFNGSRRSGPFVAVHCAALPESLLEAELFGHEKGAFTGAVGTRLGRFEAADKGTLFLDEIACLPLSTQIKLLRVLEQRTVERLGSNHPKHVDIRLILATNEDLEEKVRQGEFREDLFFRVNVFPIRLAPLRDRREDIPLLADHFLRRLRSENGRPSKRFSPEALQWLTTRDWPGNTRELSNVVETSALMADTETIGLEDLSAFASIRGAPEPRTSDGPVDFKSAVEAFEKRILFESIARANGVKARAARELGLAPTQMKYLVHKYHL